MAPVPPTRITRSAKANALTDLGKSPPKITKKNKKPDAASRPYRHNINTQNGSDSSDAEEGKSTQKATTNPARKSQASRPKFGTTKTYPGAKTQTQPLKSSIIGKVRGKSNLPGPHIVTNTKTGETLYLSASSDSSTTLFKGLHKNEPVDFFAGETPPPRLYEPKSVEVLHRLLTSFPRLRYDYQALEDVLANAQPQTPEQISKCYQDLRSAAWEWAKGTFDHGSLDRLDLMQLAETNPQLMEYINSTTASPQLTNWETWIGKRKAAIVYAILGKVIEVHVFGEEFFGASESQKAHLRKWDREKMDWDGEFLILILSFSPSILLLYSLKSTDLNTNIPLQVLNVKSSVQQPSQSSSTSIFSRIHSSQPYKTSKVKLSRSSTLSSRLSTTTIPSSPPPTPSTFPSKPSSSQPPISLSLFAAPQTISTISLPHHLQARDTIGMKWIC